MTKSTANHYINNNDLLAALAVYAKRCEDAENAGEERPIIPNYIGDCFVKLAQGVGKSRQFANYPFREDMEQDGVENCLKYMHNFNPEKTTNPFGYFTQIIWYAFLRRIAKEKKQMYVRFKSSPELLINGGTYEGGEDVTMYISANVDYINNFIADYEESLSKKKNKKKKGDDDE